MNSITIGAATVTPTTILGYEASREPRNIVHDILGRESPDVTLRPASPRRGVLRLGFAGAGSEAASLAAVNAHATGGVCSLVSDERTTVQMSYVVVGTDITRELEAETRDAWIVTVPFLEVTP